MCASVRCQVTRIGRLSALPELTEILLRLQVLLTEAYLSVLTTVCRCTTTTQHASIVRNRLHTVRWGTIHRVSALRRLLPKVLLVSRRHTSAITPRRHHLRVLTVLDGPIALHTARLLVLIVVILSAAIINNHALSLILNPKVTI